jgi:cysteine desulfurase/selenocysteine lyase
MTTTGGAATDATGRTTGPDLGRVRRDFPFLRARINDHPLVYLDSAASAQRPRSVVDAESDFALLEYANVHRGVHTLSQRATARYDQSRQRVCDFLNAPDASEIVFTAGTTAAINLVARSHARPLLRQGDEILLTEMEHHSNIVPWQLVAREVGATVRVIPVTDAGELDLDQAARLIGPRTRVVAVAHVSNVLGTVNPVRTVADLAHAAGAVLVVDGAQAVPHIRVDVQALGCDFYAASAHKMYGPNGIGVLWGRRELLEAMPPWQGGGGMIEVVSFDKTTFAPPPARFEAGTPPITQAVGFAAAIDYLGQLGWPAIERHERTLVAEATRRLEAVPGVRLIGTPGHRVGVVSFVVDDIHPHDVGTVLDLKGVAVRASHHCAQPLMRRFGVSGTVRASFGVYNTLEELDALVEGLHEARKVFGA